MVSLRAKGIPLSRAGGGERLPPLGRRPSPGAKETWTAAPRCDARFSRNAPTPGAVRRFLGRITFGGAALSGGHLRTADPRRGRCRDAETNRVPPDRHHHQTNFVADDDFLPRSAGQKPASHTTFQRRYQSTCSLDTEYRAGDGGHVGPVEIHGSLPRARA